MTKKKKKKIGVRLAKREKANDIFCYILRKLLENKVPKTHQVKANIGGANKGNSLISKSSRHNINHHNLGNPEE